MLEGEKELILNYINQDEAEIKSVSGTGDFAKSPETGKGARQKQGIVESMRETHKAKRDDVENFSSPAVVADFKETNYHLSDFVRKMQKGSTTKIWKPDKFSFGKRKNGKGVGLSLITELL